MGSKEVGMVKRLTKVQKTIKDRFEDWSKWEYNHDLGLSLILHERGGG